jgi:hypothetical protein
MMLAMLIANDAGEIQREFAAALLDPSASVPSQLSPHAGRAPQKRFAVYRNNVIASLIAALAARFPVVHRLVGDEFFRVMARLYVIGAPPRSPVLLLYGDTFPGFIENFTPAGSLEYLADVAQLEFARGRAYHAADEAPIDRSVLAALAPDEIASLRIALHPSVSLVESRFPIVSIWEAHQQVEVAPIADWRPEAALVARPRLEIEIWRLPPGGYAFLGSLAQGMTMAAATDRAGAVTAEFDAAESLAILLRANAIIGLQRESAAPS